MNFSYLNIASPHPKNKYLFSVDLIHEFSAMLFVCNFKPGDKLYHSPPPEITPGDPSTLEDDDFAESVTLGKEEIHQISNFIVEPKQNDATKTGVECCSHELQETSNFEFEKTIESCNAGETNDVFGDILNDIFDSDPIELSSGGSCCTPLPKETTDQNDYCATISLATVEPEVEVTSKPADGADDILCELFDCEPDEPSPEAFCNTPQPREETDKKVTSIKGPKAETFQIWQDATPDLSAVEPSLSVATDDWYYPDKLDRALSKPKAPLIAKGFYYSDGILKAPSFQIWNDSWEVPKKEDSTTKPFTTWEDTGKKNTSSDSLSTFIDDDKLASSAGGANSTMLWKDKLIQFVAAYVDDDKENALAPRNQNGSYVHFTEGRLFNLNEMNSYNNGSNSEVYSAQFDGFSETDDNLDDAFDEPHSPYSPTKDDQEYEEEDGRMRAIESIQGIEYMMERVFRNTKLTQHPQYPQYCSRIKRYKETILQNGYYNNYVKSTKIRGVPDYMTIMAPNKYLNNVIPALLPNLTTVELFWEKQIKTKWRYAQNKLRKDHKIGMRWCDQHLNFYEPFVYRYRTGYKGKYMDKQGLCPYCPIDESTNLDNVFYSVNNTSYMQHLCKCHGVVESGYEADPPIFVKDWSTYNVFCPTCSKCLGAIGPGDELGACLISYFNHFYLAHSTSGKYHRNDKEDFKRKVLGVKPQILYEKIAADEVEEGYYNNTVSADKVAMSNAMTDNPKKYLQLRYKKRFLHYSDKFRCQYGDAEAINGRRTEMPLRELR